MKKLFINAFTMDNATFYGALTGLIPPGVFVGNCAVYNGKGVPEFFRTYITSENERAWEYLSKTDTKVVWC